MAVDIFRFLISIAAERGWTLASLDIKAAYLQAEEYNRLVFVKTPREEGEYANLWLLMAAAYGHVDSGHLWYITSSKAMRQFGLSCRSLDSCTWILKKGNNVCLIVLVQTDNYFYTGLSGYISRFEQFVSQKFKVGSIEHDSFKVYAMSVTARDGGFIIDQNSKKVDLELYSQLPLHSRVGDSPASEREHRFAMSTIGSLLFIGRVSCPPLLHRASHFASKLKSLKVRHVKELTSRLKLAHTMDFSLRFAKPPVDQIPELVAFSDASHYRDLVCDSRIWMLVFRSWKTGAGYVFHALEFAAHKLRRVAESSKWAENQAAMKAFGGLRFLSALSHQITASSLAITLVADSLGLRDGVVGHSPVRRPRHDQYGMFARVVSQIGSQDCLVPNWRHTGWPVHKKWCWLYSTNEYTQRRSFGDDYCWCPPEFAGVILQGSGGVVRNVPL
jgi:Reverse transcriptase (RNA-dependent DNA polymerase)